MRFRRIVLIKQATKHRTVSVLRREDEDLEGEILLRQYTALTSAARATGTSQGECVRECCLLGTDLGLQSAHFSCIDLLCCDRFINK